MKPKSLVVRICMTCGSQHSRDTTYCNQESCFGSLVEDVELQINDIPYTAMREVDNRKHPVIVANCTGFRYEYSKEEWKDRWGWNE